jgi:hypothetical protein
MRDRAITKAMKGAMYWRGVPGTESSTGFDVGTDTKLRVYDKLVEVGSDPTKAAVMIERRWGGAVPECATRVEFQLRRDSLKENWQVTSVEDLFQKAHAIVEWLTQKWFRLSEEFDRENRNHDSAVTCDLWANVQAAFSSVFAGLDMVKPSLRKYVPDPKALVKQIVGCGASALAAMNEVLDSSSAYVDRMCELIREEASTAFVKYRARLDLFRVEGTLPIGRTIQAFEDWNAGIDVATATNCKQERADAFERECIQRQEAKDAVHGGRLFEFGPSEVEASF